MEAEGVQGRRVGRKEKGAMEMAGERWVEGWRDGREECLGGWVEERKDMEGH